MGIIIAHSSSLEDGVIDFWLAEDNWTVGCSGCPPHWTPDSTPVLEESGRSVSYDTRALLRDMHNDTKPYDRRV